MFSVCPHLGGGVPISHNALQHFPARMPWGSHRGGYPYPIMLCNISQNAMGQPLGGVPCQVQLGGYPARSSRGGTLPGPARGGYLTLVPPWPGQLGGYLTWVPPHQGTPPPVYPPGQVSWGGTLGGYLTWVPPTRVPPLPGYPPGGGGGTRGGTQVRTT